MKQWCPLYVFLFSYGLNIHYKVWDEIIYTFLNFNGSTVEV